MAKEKRKEFNIVDELKKDGIGPTPWNDISGKPFKDGIIEKEALPEALRFGKEVVENMIMDNESNGIDKWSHQDSLSSVMIDKNHVFAKAPAVGDIFKLTFDGKEIVAPLVEKTIYGNYGNYTWLVMDIAEGEPNYVRVEPTYIEIYFSYWGQYGTGYTGPISLSYFAEVTTPLSDEYISENIARVADILDEGVVKQDVLPEQLQFGKGVGEKEVVSNETILSLESDTAFFFDQSQSIEVLKPFADDEIGTVNVLLNGVLYSDVERTTASTEGVSFVGYGNASLVWSYGKDTGDPFYFAYRHDKGEYRVIFASRDFAGATFEAYVQDTIIETLDSDYLPKAEAVADVTDAPTAEQFNALLASLRNAGYLAT